MQMCMLFYPTMLCILYSLTVHPGVYSDVQSRASCGGIMCLSVTVHVYVTECNNKVFAACTTLYGQCCVQLRILVAY